MILFSHPTGNANVREAARALSEDGLLAEFWTSVCWNESHPLNRVFPRSVSRELARRAFPHIRRDQLRCHPWVEFGRLTARQLSLPRLTRHEVGRFSIDAVYRSLDSRVAKRLYDSSNVRGLYAYEDGALASFRVAKRLSIKTVYELPIGYWRYYRELMEQEIVLQPKWAVTMQGKGDSREKLARKDEELALANHIVVASQFVRETLQKAGGLTAPITVIPYGAPSGRALRTEPHRRDSKLRVLFVGALSQRKGLSYLLQAVGHFGSRLELTLVGRRVAECRPLDAALRAHRWIPSISHSALLDEMSHHDVLIFPSLFEGFGLVLLEAMAQGLPVIATPNTAAPDFVTDGEDGFIVPIRDAEAIAAKVESLLDHDRLTAMGEAAKRKAAQHSWEQYRRQLTATVREVLLKDASIALPMQSFPEFSECAPC